MISKLQEILGGVSAEDFFADIMGRESLFLEGTPARFTPLMRWRDVNEILMYRGLGFPRLKLMKDGRPLAPETFSRTIPSHGQSRARAAAVSDLLSKGAELSIDRVDELHEPVAALCEGIEREIETTLRADLQISCRPSPGGPPHWEDHDLLILQIEGTERCGIFAPTTNAPTPLSRPASPSGGPVKDCLLEAGDALYLPRGWWRQSANGSQPSISLKLRFRNPTALDLIARSIGHLHELEALRADVPRFRGLEGQSKYFTEVQKELMEALDQPGFLLGFEADSRSAVEPRPHFGLPWSAIGDLPALTGEVVIVPANRYPLRIEDSEDADAIEVFFDGNRLRFPPAMRDLFDRLFDGGSHRLSAFFEENQPEFEFKAIAMLLRELAVHGLIVFRDEEECGTVSCEVNGLAILERV
jgi:hypothetical protein